MGRKKSYINSHSGPLPIALQGAGLSRLIPDSTLQFNKNVSLTWTGRVQPTEMSEVYTIRIRYRLRERPQVTVLEPELTSRNGDRIPHLFPGNELCLFRYKYFEWNSRMSLADTVLPWASLWLLHYEIWHATGVWCGSKQEHPESDKPKEPEQTISDMDK